MNKHDFGLELSTSDLIGAVFGVGGIGTGLFVVSSLSDAERRLLFSLAVVIAAFLLLLNFYIKLRKSAVKLASEMQTQGAELSRLQSEKRLPSAKVRRLVSGDGQYAGAGLLVVDNPGYFSAGDVGVLTCRSSGAIQGIALVRIVEARGNDEVIAVLFPKATGPDSLRPYFEDDAKREGLYLVPNVSHDMLMRSLGVEDRARS